MKRLQLLSGELPNTQYAIVGNANHEMMFLGNEKMQIGQETTRNEIPQAPSYSCLWLRGLLGMWITRAGHHRWLIWRQRPISSRRNSCQITGYPEVKRRRTLDRIGGLRPEGREVVQKSGNDVSISPKPASGLLSLFPTLS